ncbi:MAG: acyltransferase [Lachnospiraceae bacterium]|nr:acyltransferase [Lachnospiraceae bacterium]
METARERIRYYDLLRVVCFALIIYYHMMMELFSCGIYPIEALSPFFENPNMHIATLAVAVFFMLSGASLTIGNETDFNTVTYYRKRFIRLLIPFWIVNCFYFLYNIFVLGSRWFRQYAPWRIVYTILGVDGWVGMHGFDNFSLGVGEWFLGALVILSVLYPLLRYLMNRFPKGFFFFCLLVYLVVAYNYKWETPSHYSLPLKGFEFVLGMYLGKYYKEFPKKALFVSLPVVFLFLVNRSTVIPVNVSVKITVFALAFFVSFSYLEPYLRKRKLKWINVLSKYSYELFLVHHIVIYRLTPRAAAYLNSVPPVILLFIVELMVMALLTFLLKFLSDKVIGLLIKV